MYSAYQYVAMNNRPLSKEQSLHSDLLKQRIPAVLLLPSYSLIVSLLNHYYLDINILLFLPFEKQKPSGSAQPELPGNLLEMKNLESQFRSIESDILSKAQ